MPTFIYGKDAKLYRGPAGSVANIEVPNVRNVTLTLEAGEADVTTRANQGWRATAPTLRECTVEFEMLDDPTDAGFAAMRTAFLTGALIALLPLNKLAGEGPDADFAITSFSRGEELEEAVTVNVTAKLSVFREWKEATP